jgi:hypothetical protein
MRSCSELCGTSIITCTIYAGERGRSLSIPATPSAKTRAKTTTRVQNGPRLHTEPSDRRVPGGGVCAAVEEVGLPVGGLELFPPRRQRGRSTGGRRRRDRRLELRLLHRHAGHWRHVPVTVPVPGQPGLQVSRVAPPRWRFFHRGSATAAGYAARGNAERAPHFPAAKQLSLLCLHDLHLPTQDTHNHHLAARRWDRMRTIVAATQNKCTAKGTYVFILLGHLLRHFGRLGFMVWSQFFEACGGQARRAHLAPSHCNRSSGSAP